MSTYWLKRPELFVPIASLSVSCACLRQIARYLGVSHATVARHLSRAARLCLLFHHQRLSTLTITEPIAFDGFETFEHSQFFPCHFHLAAGTRSWFLYHFTDSPLRRSGTMTSQQKTRRAALESTLGRPDPKAVETDVSHLLDVIAQRADPRKPLLLQSDEHRTYPRAVRHLRSLHPDLEIRHHTTPSTDPRTRANALFSINLADLMLRHSASDHKRETIAFAKRRQGSAERIVIHLVWRNYAKKQRENGPITTAAMIAGAAMRPLTLREILSRRRFPGHVPLPARWRDYYQRTVRTAALPRQNSHELRYAF